jgi:hypothetical protein
MRKGSAPVLYPHESLGTGPFAFRLTGSGSDRVAGSKGARARGSVRCSVRGHYNGPVGPCKEKRILFPQSPSVPQSKRPGLDPSKAGATVRREISYAGTLTGPSTGASHLTQQLADVPVSAKPVEPVARRIGQKRVAERDGNTALPGGPRQGHGVADARLAGHGGRASLGVWLGGGTAVAAPRPVSLRMPSSPAAGGILGCSMVRSHGRACRQARRTG